MSGMRRTGSMNKTDVLLQVWVANNIRRRGSPDVPYMDFKGRAPIRIGSVGALSLVS